MWCRLLSIQRILTPLQAHLLTALQRCAFTILCSKMLVATESWYDLVHSYFLLWDCRYGVWDLQIQTSHSMDIKSVSTVLTTSLVVTGPIWLLVLMTPLQRYIFVLSCMFWMFGCFIYAVLWWCVLWKNRSGITRRRAVFRHLKDIHIIFLLFVSILSSL